MPLFQKLHFTVSVADAAQLPRTPELEVAIAGRSNSGKSSVINTLANRNRLAFVSKTPGRTQLINFFHVGNGHNLVDLPGYGYARVPQAVRGRWHE
ncbi:MAG: ribosome biogenesis GTP-binding protein YihA/YsxC, partial [Burkholderiales bacterium]